jgi:hypothetical protein
MIGMNKEKESLPKIRLEALNTTIDILQQLSAAKAVPKTEESFSNEMLFLQLLLVLKDWGREIEGIIENGK